MPITKIRLAVLPLLVLAAGGCTREDEKSSLLTPPQGFTSDFDADVAIQWMDLVTASIDAEDLNAPEASRIIGYAGVTLYESVVPGMLQRKSLGGQLSGLATISNSSGQQHWPTIANEALATVLTGLFANAQPTTLQAIADLKAAFEVQFATEANSSVIANSVSRGMTVASRINTWIGGDNFATVNDCAYVVPTGPGLWEPTPPAFNPDPIEPCWGSLRTSFLLFASECAPLGFPAYSTDPTSAFALEAMEVYDTVNNLDQAQMDIANFWADGAGSITTPGHWVNITSTVLTDEGSSLDIAAEAYAKVGLAMADAYVSTWSLKYFYNLLRPVTYIQDPAGPINDPAWMSFVTTPDSPEFTSDVAVASAAASYVLTNLFGTTSFTDDTYSPARSFSTFNAAAQEAASAGLFGGTQFRSGIQRGFEQGTCIGQTALQNVDFVKP